MIKTSQCVNKKKGTPIKRHKKEILIQWFVMSDYLFFYDNKTELLMNDLDRYLLQDFKTNS